MSEQEREVIQRLGLGDDAEWMRFGGIAYPAIHRKVTDFGIDPDQAERMTGEIMIRIVLVLREVAAGQTDG